MLGKAGEITLNIKNKFYDVVRGIYKKYRQRLAYAD